MASAPSDLDVEGYLAAAEARLRDAELLSAQGGLSRGWVVTAAFYASLHAVSAYVLARHRVLVVAHRDRSDWFSVYPELTADRFSFVSLKRRSEAFRYYDDPVTAAAAEEAIKVARRFVSKWGDRAKKVT